MPFSTYPPRGPFTGEGRAVDRLTSNEYFGEYWETEFGGLKVFYVRGTTRFKSGVVKEASRVYRHIDKMQALVYHLQTPPDRSNRWGSPNFDWNDEFSRVQVGEAWKLHPLAFDKAVKVILLCGVVAEEERHEEGRTDSGRVATGAETYGRMWIEPAVYFVHGFNPQALSQIKASDEGFLQKLKEATGQKNTTVFTDMTNGKTVTLKLAKGVQEGLRSAFPSLDIGDVDIPQGRRFTASEHENVDLK